MQTPFIALIELESNLKRMYCSVVYDTKNLVGLMQEPAKLWEKLLLDLEVAGSQPGIDGEEVAPLAKENVPTP